MWKLQWKLNWIRKWDAMKEEHHRKKNWRKLIIIIIKKSGEKTNLNTQGLIFLVTTNIFHRPWKMNEKRRQQRRRRFKSIISYWNLQWFEMVKWMRDEGARKPHHTTQQTATNLLTFTAILSSSYEQRNSPSSSPSSTSLSSTLQISKYKWKKQTTTKIHRIHTHTQRKCHRVNVPVTMSYKRNVFILWFPS